MANGIALPISLAGLFAAAIGLALLEGCDSLLSSQTPLPPPSFKPVVTFVSPKDGSAAAVNDRVRIDATAEDGNGILRVDLLINGTVVDSQPLFVAARRFEYVSTWQPTAAGESRLTIVAYNVNNVASDPVTVLVTVSGLAVTATGVAGTATQTPFVIFVTSTPPPTHQVVTPAVTVITATPPPTHPPASAGIPARTIAVTATITPTKTLPSAAAATPSAKLTPTGTPQ